MCPHASLALEVSNEYPIIIPTTFNAPSTQQLSSSAPIFAFPFGPGIGHRSSRGPTKNITPRTYTHSFSSSAAQEKKRAEGEGPWCHSRHTLARSLSLSFFAAAAFPFFFLYIGFKLSPPWQFYGEDASRCTPYARRTRCLAAAAHGHGRSPQLLNANALLLEGETSAVSSPLRLSFLFPGHLLTSPLLSEPYLFHSVLFLARLHRLLPVWHTCQVRPVIPFLNDNR